MTRTPPEIAIAQPRMFWSSAENIAESISIATHAAKLGAQICVFPELSLTGYHRRIKEEAIPAIVEPSLRQMKLCAKQLQMTLAIGLPTFLADGGIRNAYMFIGPQGEELATVEKRGLTEPEATFFVQGSARPVIRLAGLSYSAVMCREIEDIELVCEDFAAERPNVLLWPGLMGPEEGTEHLDPPRHVQQAQEVARRTNSYIVQSNWPMSLNYPELSAKAGRSVVIGPDGCIQAYLPQAKAGFALFTLGSVEYAWHATEV